ncbi:hypothetical protein [Agromyces neolithicus]|uniref:Uncharacterized protein n=1 Tax=Agromyces neolithicus TaxID=269420 RepID=A0ABN2LZK2_9MICO
MSSDQAPSEQGSLPDGDALDRSADQPDGADEVFDDGGWGAAIADALSDPAAGDPTVANMFSAEIENVNASDWDVDAALIWGDAGDDTVIDGGSTGLDFPL